MNIKTTYDIGPLVYWQYKIAIERKETRAMLRERLNIITDELQKKKPNGRAKYPSRFCSAFIGAASAFDQMLYSEHLEFCYKYNGVFYSTRKNTGRETTNYLHNLLLDQKTWDSLERGFYWINSDTLFY